MKLFLTALFMAGCGIFFMIPGGVSAQEPLPKVSCPVANGSIITNSYDANPSRGHCGSSYGYSCKCGTQGRRAKAIDIKTSGGQDVILPAIENKRVVWTLIETYCAGGGSYPNCTESNGGTGGLYTFRGVDPSNPSERWYIQFVHMNISTVKMRLGGEYTPGTIVGKSDSTAHVHAVIGKNLSEIDGSVTGTADCDPNWIASDFMCDPSKQPPAPTNPDTPTKNTGSSQEAVSNLFCTKVGSPSGPIPEACTQMPRPTGGAVPMPGGGTTSGAGDTFYCQGDPKWGSRCAMAYAGCGPTSMAMVLSSFGDVMTPPEVDEIFNRRGWRACGDAPSYMTTAISVLMPEYGYTYRQLSIGAGLDLNQAKEYLDNGYLIIGSVSIHIFVVDGVDISNNTVHLRDPAVCNPAGVISPNSAPWRGYPWYYAYAIKKNG